MRTSRLPAAAFAAASALSLSVCLFLPRAALADTTSSDVAAARTLGAEGVKLANHGKCTEAIDKLERSEKLYHSPTALGRLGECYVEVGRLVKGTEALRRVVRDQLAPGAPAAFVAARARAEKVLATAEPRIPLLRIVVNGPADVKPDATFDGEPLSPAALGVDWPVDPGVHQIKVNAPGYLEASSSVTLKEAERRAVTLTLAVDPDAAKAPAEVSNGPTPIKRPHDDGDDGAGDSRDRRDRDRGSDTGRGPSHAPAYAALVVGGLGLAVGAVTGALFLKSASDLETACPGKVCDAKHANDLSTTKTLGNVSTIAFGVGGVAIVTGLVMLAVSPSSSSSGSSARVSPAVGLGWGGVTGRFQ